MLASYLGDPRVAYFSMEIALRAEIPTYSGGLGVLAGDTVRTGADLDMRMVAVTLVSREGYFRQRLTVDGVQNEEPQRWNPADWASPLEARVSLQLQRRTVWIGGWLYLEKSSLGGALPVVLLDTDLPDNAPEDRELTHRLYGGDETYRLKQEAILGIGGMRMLAALGFRVFQYHLNEGHSALLTLELLRRHRLSPAGRRPGESTYDVPRVRELCSFTTHTPVEAGHDRFSYALVAEVLDEYVDVETLRRFGGEQELNLTRLALSLSECVNGVALRHAETSRRMFPGYEVRAITNGVHAVTWVCPELAAVFDRRIVRWRQEPELLVRADCCVPADELWAAHLGAKRRLIERVRAATGVALDEAKPILGYARRMTEYKRPELLFTDLERLRRIAGRHPFQIVLAGKAHPRDARGKELIALTHRAMRGLGRDLPCAYLPDYDMSVAKDLVAGVDVWLNTPLPPLEASGTSGMKAALNGVPSLSVLDGWWVEGCIEGVTGWAIGSDGPAGAVADAESLYSKLEQTVLPLFHSERPRWLAIMQAAIAKNGSTFNSHRMMRRYVTDAYLR
jgi:starch phosphorylase